MPLPRPLTVRIAEAVYRYDRAVSARRISDRKREARKARALRQLDRVLGARDLGGLRDALLAELSDAPAMTIAACALRLISDRADHHARYDALVALMRALPEAVKDARAQAKAEAPCGVADSPPAWTGRADIGG